MSSKRVKTKLWMKDYNAFQKGYSFDVEALIGANGAAFRVYNGYRFSRMAMLSIGVGLEIDNVSKALPSLSMNIALSGDILQKRITPYYQVELGCGVVLNRRTQTEIHTAFEPSLAGTYPYEATETINYGGPMGALVFGAKLKTKKKIYYKVGLDWRITSNFYDATNVYVEDMNEKTALGKTQKVLSVYASPGLRFGIGF